MGGTRKAVWNFVKNLLSSTQAKAFAVVSSLFVLVSIVAMTLNTVEEMKTHTLYGRIYMEWVEIISISLFTMEYILRFTTSCKPRQFLGSTLHFLDFVAILPYFVPVLFEAYCDLKDQGSQEDLRTMASVTKLGQVLKVVKLSRVFCILKLACHSTNMRAFVFTLHQCFSFLSTWASSPFRLLCILWNEMSRW